MAGIEHPGVSSDPLTPVVFLERTLRVFPERTAVVHRDQRLSYAEFAEETGRMAGALRRAGVQEGDRVAILSPNTPWHLAAHFAAPLLGAPLVSMLFLCPIGNWKLGAVTSRASSLELPGDL